MKTYTIVSAATGPVTSAVFRLVGTGPANERMIVQVDAAGSCNLELQGRIASGAGWVRIGDAITASALLAVDTVREIRVVIVSASAAVSVYAGSVELQQVS